MPRDARKQGLSRRHRFGERGSFGPLLKSGRKIRGTHAVLHFAKSQTGSARLGVALTRRILPAATARNEVKRVVREAFRTHVAKQAAIDCVITLRPGPIPQNATLRAEIGALLDQLVQAPSR
jgi:ribonuclease P protein component